MTDRVSLKNPNTIFVKGLKALSFQNQKFNIKMKRLTKGEEEVMHIIWELDRCLVSDIIKQMGTPTPPHSTISSIVRILEKKGFLNHKAYGRTHEYFPIITKEEYSKKTIKKFVGDYFEGSMNSLVSFLVKEKDLDIEELTAMLKQMEEEKDSKKD